MNPEIKQLWLTALRSGEYQHGRFGLRRNHRFCCLGVLCDLYRKEHPKTQWEPPEITPFSVFLGEKQYLPREVADWAGLTQNDPAFLLNETRHTLSSFNDSPQSTFNKLANIIETQL